MRIINVLSENNFLVSGSGEDANPGDGSWLYDDDEI